MLRHVNRAGSTFWIENDPLPFFWTFPKIHPIWRSHTSLKIKSLQTSNKALQTWSRIKSKGANWCPKQRCKCFLHHFALPHGLFQGNCEKARSEYIYCKDNCILIDLHKSSSPLRRRSRINLPALVDLFWAGGVMDSIHRGNKQHGQWSMVDGQWSKVLSSEAKPSCCSIFPPRELTCATSSGCHRFFSPRVLFYRQCTPIFVPKSRLPILTSHKPW